MEYEIMKWSSMTESQKAQLKQVFTQGIVGDEHVFSKLDAQELTDMGFLTKFDGCFFIEKIPPDFPSMSNY